MSVETWYQCWAENLVRPLSLMPAWKMSPLLEMVMSLAQTSEGISKLCDREKQNLHRKPISTRTS